jgi:hypothetical protein
VVHFDNFLGTVLFRAFEAPELEEIRRAVGIPPLGPDAEKLRQIARLRAKGETLSGIGRKLGMSRQAVREALKKVARG